MKDKPEEEPWNIEEGRSKPGDYVLNTADRKYCASGEPPGTLHKSQVKKRIKENRLEELPTRFQDLLDDIALLRYSNDEFLMEDEQSSLWKEIQDVEKRSSELLQMDITLSPEDSRCGSTRFGFELGALIRALSQHSHETNDLLWGFLLGLHSLPPAAAEYEEEYLNQALNHLSEKNEQRSKFSRERKQSNERNQSVSRENEQRILDRLDEYGITMDRIPVSFRTIYDSYSFKNYPFTIEEIDNAITENSDIDLLQSLDNLRWAVEGDGTLLKEKKFRSVEALPIMSELWEKTPEIESNKSHNGTSLEDLNSVSDSNTEKALLNRLSGKDIDWNNKDHEMVDKVLHPIVTEDGSGWKLTNYGKLVCFSLFDLNSRYTWIYKYELFGQSIPKEYREIIEQANDEVGYW